MKLYSASRAPNPRRVLIYLAEKGLNVPVSEVDLGALEQRSGEFTALNPFQRTPVLALDDGAVICESIAICRYFEELHPEPPLFGVGALGRAMVEMWQRRLELGLLLHVANAFRHAHPYMAKMETPQIAELARISPAKALDAMAIVDRELKDRPFIAGERFSVADITGLVALDFTKVARIGIPAEFVDLRRWRDELAARPSAKA
ncbi:MAG TPA: glutathione S-transferase [Roseiarcus sp.]|jgi:glutathione S-transferase|nr:glutathione S-transferase [Roseiarcus sp.]